MNSPACPLYSLTSARDVLAFENQVHSIYVSAGSTIQIPPHTPSSSMSSWLWPGLSRPQNRRECTPLVCARDPHMACSFCMHSGSWWASVHRESKGNLRIHHTFSFPGGCWLGFFGSHGLKWTCCKEATWGVNTAHKKYALLFIFCNCSSLSLT